MLMMLWLVKHIYLTDICSFYITDVVVIWWLLTTTVDTLRGVFFFDNRWNMVPICVKLVWHIATHCRHRCWLGPSHISIAERDAYGGSGLRRI